MDEINVPKLKADGKQKDRLKLSVHVLKQELLLQLRQ